MNTLKFIFCLTLLIGLVNSCKDACDDVNCGAFGTCVEGTCDCDEGYSGTNCEINVCDNVDCGENGNCNTAGECDCNEGYEGDMCETESRVKHIGTYTGNLLPCLPDFLANLIPTDQLGLLESTPLGVTASDEGITKIAIADAGGVLGVNVVVDINEPNFDIEAFEQNVDLAGTNINVSGEGTGEIIDENTIVMNFTLAFKALGFTFPADCIVTFTKG